MSFEYRQLISAIFFRMLQDWRRGHDHEEILKFMQDEIFSDMAEALGLRPAHIRARVEAGQFNIKSYRAAYR